MIITITIDVPDYVYLFFQKEAKSWNRETAEAQMSAYLTQHVRRTMTARAKKVQTNDIQKETGGL